MNCHHLSGVLLSLLAFENMFCPEKESNTLEFFSTSLVLFLTSLIFFFLLFPSAVVIKRRKVIGSLVLGFEVLGDCGLPRWRWW